MSRIQWEAETEYRMLAAEFDACAQELCSVWEMLHSLVEKTRTTHETNCPKLYRSYDELCLAHKETPRQARLLDD